MNPNTHLERFYFLKSFFDLIVNERKRCACSLSSSLTNDGGDLIFRSLWFVPPAQPFTEDPDILSWSCTIYRVHTGDTYRNQT